MEFANQNLQSGVDPYTCIDLSDSSKSTPFSRGASLFLPTQGHLHGRSSLSEHVGRVFKGIGNILFSLLFYVIVVPVYLQLAGILFQLDMTIFTYQSRAYQYYHSRKYTQKNPTSTVSMFTSNEVVLTTVTCGPSVHSNLDVTPLSATQSLSPESSLKHSEGQLYTPSTLKLHQQSRQSEIYPLGDTFNSDIMREQQEFQDISEEEESPDNGLYVSPVCHSKNNKDPDQHSIDVHKDPLRSTIDQLEEEEKEASPLDTPHNQEHIQKDDKDAIAEHPLTWFTAHEGAPLTVCKNSTTEHKHWANRYAPHSYAQRILDGHVSADTIIDHMLKRGSRAQFSLLPSVDQTQHVSTLAVPSDSYCPCHAERCIASSLQTVLNRVYSQSATVPWHLWLLPLCTKGKQQTAVICLFHNSRCFFPSHLQVSARSLQGSHVATTNCHCFGLCTCPIDVQLNYSQRVQVKDKMLPYDTAYRTTVAGFAHRFLHIALETLNTTNTITRPTWRPKCTCFSVQQAYADNSPLYPGKSITDQAELAVYTPQRLFQAVQSKNPEQQPDGQFGYKFFFSLSYNELSLAATVFKAILLLHNTTPLEAWREISMSELASSIALVHKRKALTAQPCATKGQGSIAQEDASFLVCLIQWQLVSWAYTGQQTQYNNAIPSSFESVKNLPHMQAIELIATQQTSLQAINRDSAEIPHVAKSIFHQPAYNTLMSIPTPARSCGNDQCSAQKVARLTDTSTKYHAMILQSGEFQLQHAQASLRVISKTFLPKALQQRVLDHITDVDQSCNIVRSEAGGCNTTESFDIPTAIAQKQVAEAYDMSGGPAPTHITLLEHGTQVRVSINTKRSILAKINTEQFIKETQRRVAQLALLTSDLMALYNCGRM